MGEKNILEKREKLRQVNAFAVISIFFLYSLTTLPGLYVDQGVLTIGLSVVLYLPIILQNLMILYKKSILRAMMIEVFVLVVLLIQDLIYVQYSKAIHESIIYLVTIGTIGLFVGSFEFRLKDCVKYGQPLSYICAVTSLIYLWLVPNKFLMSMRFGYAILPSVMWFLLMAVHKRSLFSFILFVVGLVVTVAWGSRGALLAILFFVLLFFLKYHKVVFAVVSILSIPFLGLFRGSMLSIFNWIANVTHARKIEKIITMFEENSLEDSSSGRDVLYDRCVDLISQNPMGNGVGWWSVDPFMGGLFPHNIFLQVGTEFGIVGLAILIFVLIVSVKKLFSFGNVEFLMLIYVFSITIGRLMVSSMFWARLEFWLFLALFLCAGLKENNAIIVKQ